MDDALSFYFEPYPPCVFDGGGRLLPLQLIICFMVLTRSSVSVTIGGYAAGRGSRFMSWSSKSQVSVMGDIAFLVENKPVLIFEGVQDPQNLAKYIRILMHSSTQQNSLPC
jgi:hypothetical protein